MIHVFRFVTPLKSMDGIPHFLLSTTKFPYPKNIFSE